MSRAISARRDFGLTRNVEIAQRIKRAVRASLVDPAPSLREVGEKLSVGPARTEEEIERGFAAGSDESGKEESRKGAQ